MFFIVQYVIDGRISRIAGLHLDFRQICTPGDDTRPDGRHRLRYANGGEGGTIGKRIVANRNYGIGYGEAKARQYWNALAFISVMVLGRFMDANAEQ